MSSEGVDTENIFKIRNFILKEYCFNSLKIIAPIQKSRCFK